MPPKETKKKNAEQQPKPKPKAKAKAKVAVAQTTANTGPGGKGNASAQHTGLHGGVSDAERFSHELARAVARGQPYPLAGPPPALLSTYASGNPNQFYELSIGRTNAFQLPRIQTRCLLASGYATSEISIGLSTGVARVLVYALPDQTAAFAVLAATTRMERWPVAADFDIDGIIFTGAPPRATFKPLSMAGWDTTEVVAYHPGHNPFTAVSDGTVGDNYLHPQLCTLGEGRLTVEVVNTDREIVYQFETPSGGIDAALDSADAGNHQWDLVNGTATQNNPTAVSSNVRILSSQRETARPFGFDHQKGPVGLAYSRCGDWQRIACDANTFRSIRKQHYETNRTLSFVDSSDPTWTSSHQHKLSPTDPVLLAPRPWIPDPQRSRGLWVSVTITGPADKTALLKIRYSDWYGLLPTHGDAPYNIPHAMSTSTHPYPSWFQKRNAAGMAGRQGVQRTLHGVVAAHAIASEPIMPHKRDKAAALVEHDDPRTEGRTGDTWWGWARDVANELGNVAEAGANALWRATDMRNAWRAFRGPAARTALTILPEVPLLM